MRKLFQEDFIRWEEGNNKGQINWKRNEGRLVRFIYDDIQGVIKILDKVSSRRINVMYNNKIIEVSVVNRYWGSLNKMKETLGLEIVQENMIDKSKTREELKDDILKYIEKYGDIPQSNDFGKGELMSTSVYYNEFGGIGKAIKVCGYKPKKKSDFRDISKEEIIRIYKEAVEEHGVQSTDFYDELELPSTTTCCRRFNCGWDDFLIMLGYEPYENS